MGFVRRAIGMGMLAGLALVTAAGAQESRNPAFDALDQVGFDQKLGDPVPLDLTFTDSEGNAVRLGDYFGDRPVILSLVYYECPMLCTQVLNGLNAALKVVSFDVGNEFDVITISFDPSETPELAAQKKESYVASYGREGAADGWHFLTGDSQSIAALTEAVGFRYVFQPEAEQFAHASGILVLTPDGTQSRLFYGIEYPPRDLRLGLIEAAEGEIGSPVDQVLLYCFHYDPRTGKYGMVILNVIRLAGGVTVLGLAILIVGLLRRERRATRRLVPTAR